MCPGVIALVAVTPMSYATSFEDVQGGLNNTNRPDQDQHRRSTCSPVLPTIPLDSGRLERLSSIRCLQE